MALIAIIPTQANDAATAANEMGSILADFRASQIRTLFVPHGQILNADELPAQFQPEFHLVPLGVASEIGKSSTVKRNYIGRFRLLTLEFSQDQCKLLQY